MKKSNATGATLAFLFISSSASAELRKAPSPSSSADLPSTTAKEAPQEAPKRPEADTKQVEPNASEPALDPERRDETPSSTGGSSDETFLPTPGGDSDEKPSQTWEESSAAQPESHETEDEAAPTPARKISPLTEAPDKPLARRFSTLVLLEGFGRYGGIVRGDNIQDEANRTNVENSRAGNAGGQATLAILPGHGAFTMGGRIQGGTYLGKGVTLGNLGATMLFGANFGRSSDGRSFSYALGGLGVNFVPAENQDMLMLHLGGGTVVDGISFGGGIDLGGNDEFGVIMVGMQIGWGHLY